MHYRLAPFRCLTPPTSRSVTCQLHMRLALCFDVVTESPRSDSNRRPAAYKAAALAGLSYRGNGRGESPRNLPPPDMVSSSTSVTPVHPLERDVVFFHEPRRRCIVVALVGRFILLPLVGHWDDVAGRQPEGCTRFAGILVDER